MAARIKSSWVGKVVKGPSFHPEACSVQRQLLLTSLGTLQITSGLINIGLGPGRIGFKPLDVASMGAAYWLGLVFITAGIISIVAARIKTPSVVKLATIMNRVEAAFALLSIVLYILDLRDNSVRRMCSRTTGGGGNCWVVANFAQRLLIFMDVTLILVSLLQVIVSRAFALIDSTSSTTETKMEEEDVKNVENQETELKEVVNPDTPGDLS